MSVWSRVRNVFRGDAVNGDITEELETHVAEAVASGRDEREARRAMGQVLRQREESHFVRVVGWMDSLRADVVFGWRQLSKRKITSAAAVLSLAIGIGSCVAAFRLIDALFLRPLPIHHPEQLYALSRQGLSWDGRPDDYDAWAYPDFQRMRAAAAPDAELIAVSYADHTDLTYTTAEEMEKGNVQYVSGWIFQSFGLQPALGRLLTEADDQIPGGHPYAVLSYDYWTRRFGRDAKILGRTLHIGEQTFEIVGVGPKTFTGTEPGMVTEVFLPTMMNSLVTRSDATWHATLAMVHPGVSVETLRAKLDTVSRNFEAERAKGQAGATQRQIDNAINQRLQMDPARSGASGMQKSYGQSLMCLTALGGLVLLIACANVANLMTAQTASRAREMALRVSLGSGRTRLMQLVLVESAMLALLAATLGGLFAAWSWTKVMHMAQTPNSPGRLILSSDWRIFGFGLLLTLVVTLLFGAAPALRASAIQPVHALKGGEAAETKRRSMYALVALQTAICFVVIFLAGLFVTTFQRLSNRPRGFETKGLLLLETVAPHGRPVTAWNQVADTLKAMPGVQEVAEAGWPMLSGESWNGSVSIDGGPASQEWSYFLSVSPNWRSTMKIPLLAGRDIQSNDTYPGEIVVNQAFVKHFLNGQDPLGKIVEKASDDGPKQLSRVVGVMADAPYRDLHEATLPVAFVPLRHVDEKGAIGTVSSTTFVLRTSTDDPAALAAEMRRKVAQASTGFRVSDVETQQELVDDDTIRERMLASLGTFIGGVALLLAAIGLYGVLHYLVIQREREIGIRIALGAAAANIARIVAGRVLVMVIAGAVAGLAASVASVRFVSPLLYGIRGTEVSTIALPAVVLLLAGCCAALPAVLRAVRVDPVVMLRSE